MQPCETTIATSHAIIMVIVIVIVIIIVVIIIVIVIVIVIVVIIIIVVIVVTIMDPMALRNFEDNRAHGSLLWRSLLLQACTWQSSTTHFGFCD